MRVNTKVVVLARRSGRLATLLADERWAALGDADGYPELTVWTDDYINILAPLWAKWK